ncbi:putative ammonia monooxygenase [Erwinia phage Machina]|uniref:Putative ammonia monooxygenase n=2 Tax=Machinavirus machina TaxID=2169990 RepID=A0A1B2ID49_9CAUD|nr:putative ammonia monooxygenase [Erwinia phage vB_EamM_Huxley]YP_009617022.1 putative ammonia monooxygenase [Erwinia phage Machina]ANZ49188.1 putative ammonia monooxygenase [Erwinia phage vB_EamM_Huxley]ANZ49743.1 putative ammonia monooxygenase [Erwinia phage Machina]ANZ50016.1 putative ammonia monooxygenase [Erwinia phage vB_EamM_Parshik]
MRVKRTSDGKLSFLCPGCGVRHTASVSSSGGPQWSWNGDVDRPTLTPSVLVRSGHYVPGHDKSGCWCTYYADHPDEDPEDSFKCGVCHSFVTDGNIQFLNDCTHALAGKTVPLPELQED